MRASERLARLERQAAEAGLAELTAFGAGVGDAIVASLEDAIADGAISDRTRTRVAERLRSDHPKRYSRLTCGLDFARADREEVLDSAGYLCSVVAEAAEECACVVALTKQIRERLAERLRALVDTVRPAAVRRVESQRRLLPPAPTIPPNPRRPQSGARSEEGTGTDPAEKLSNLASTPHACVRDVAGR